MKWRATTPGTGTACWRRNPGSPASAGGRPSGVKFDDMVRMDLRYANSWSLWLDIKILLQTPHAVISASGAH